MIHLLGKYQNGNYVVKLFENGTKIRETKENEFLPQFAENIDLKITNRCTGTNCPFCHEGSGPCGKHSDILNEKFIYTLKPYQEIAAGGGNVLEHPDLLPFLHLLKSKNVITNITVNQKHFEAEQELIKQLVNEKLIYGLGVSLVNPNEEFIHLIKKYPNAVIHVINGLLTKENMESLSDNDLKMLILGYKTIRRGELYLKQEMGTIHRQKQWLYQNLEHYFERFNTISFDKLAIEQLDVKRFLSEEEWNQFYMGDDASFTYYIDAVERKFAKSSTAPFQERFDLENDVVEMFQKIKN